MKQLNSGNKYLAAILLSALSSSAFAHVNIAPETALTAGEKPREYVEGSRAYIQLNLPEDCATEDRSQRFPIASTVVILPSGTAISEDFYTTGRGSDELFGANIMMRSKPRASANWIQVGVETGDVGAFGSRATTTDTRVLKWLGGRIKTGQVYDNAEFVTSLPKIKAESCVKKVRVEIPTVTYCTDGYSRAWIGTPNSRFQPSPKQVVEESYEPYFYVVRAKSNPLSAACGEGEETTVRPTDEDINQYAGDWIQESPNNPYN